MVGGRVRVGVGEDEGVCLGAWGRGRGIVDGVDGGEIEVCCGEELGFVALVCAEEVL